MTKYIYDVLNSSPFGKVVDVSFVDKDGKVNFIKAVDLKVMPVFSFGGAGNVFQDHATDRSHGTPIATYDTGEVTNPLYAKPSSFFLPTPQNISTAFFGNPLFLTNRSFLAGFMLVMSELKGENKTYSNNYKVLPDMVIDNEELELELFGEI